MEMLTPRPGLQGFRFSKIPEKWRISRFFEEIIFILFFVLFWKFHFLMRHSTSPPCGNQVDGLPHDVHNTGAALASWGPKKCWHLCNFRGFFLKVMHSYIKRKAVGIFRSKFSKNYVCRANHLLICSTKSMLNVTSKFW